MDGMLSYPGLSTPSLSSIQPGLTWHRVGGVWVHTFQDHYACCVAAILPGA